MKPNLNIRRLDTQELTFADVFEAMADLPDAPNQLVEDSVRQILESVLKGGDDAVVQWTNRFDARQITDFSQLCVRQEELESAFDRLDVTVRDALETAHGRIHRYHVRQQQHSWSMTDDDGNLMGQEVRALDRVGIYIPGGRASYPSTVLMTAVPAKVAGVGEIVMTVPAPEDVLNDSVLGAAFITGVDRVFTVGGAQAIAALAYGTETISPVDKIVGPGNDYVAAAKRLVYGRVGIDMIAGPSEILIISDGNCPPLWTAIDMCAQAEHDPSARVILISTEGAYLDSVLRELPQLVADLERGEIVSESLEKRGVLIRARDLDEAIALSNRLAPEHLQLVVAEPSRWIGEIRNAGSVFMGRYSPEALGDYCAGPNHVLPTAGTARFTSPLGVYDFQKRFSYIDCSKRGAASIAKVAAIIARDEGLTAHAQSAECRLYCKENHE